MSNKKPLKKDPQTQQVKMTLQNLKNCALNQNGFEYLYLNDSLQLQFCSFSNIDNLQHAVNKQTQEQRKKRLLEYKQKMTQEQLKQNRLIQVQLVTKGVNTIFLNNNVLTKIQNLHPLKNSLKTLNLSFNRIEKFQGLKQLHQLEILDLSNNKLSFINQGQAKGLHSLSRLNLNSNLFENKQGILALKQLQKSLQILQMTNNQLFQPNQIQILDQIFVYMTKLKLLSFKDTQFARRTSNYRKQIIYYVPSLTFLDDRPVSQDQKILVNAWKKGGLAAEKQARKNINEKKQEKNKNIMQDIEYRKKLVQEKVQKLYVKKGKQQIEELKRLKTIKNKEDFDLKEQNYQTQISLKIEQLQKYLQLLKQSCRHLDLDKQLGIGEQDIPKMLIQNRTSECIYIYNVTQKQLQLIKKKHYPFETLPLIAKNYVKPEQPRWLEQDYNSILLKIFNICKGKWEIIVPSFNLQIYEFDQRAYRNLKRFNQNQLIQKYSKARNQSDQTNNNQQNFVYHNKQDESVNNLDCLD